MQICFPVKENEGLESRVYGHFGSAPMFVVVDSETRRVREVLNRDRSHTHGACRPLKALGGSVLDAIIVGGIGSGALSGLNRAGFRVYKAQSPTVEGNLERFEKGELEEFDWLLVCAGHQHGHGCGS